DYYCQSADGSYNPLF
nr:immunoglobulin light chain junction region [Macaca mulatta]MOV73144.1 immunoglobulin light chain junction region [Macaca mulatta]